MPIPPRLHIHPRPRPRLHRHQGGAALLITLLMLSVVMLLGISAARTALMNEKSSRNDRDRQIAFQAAEAALHDAELGMTGLRGQPYAFPKQAGHCHTGGAFSGLCRAGDTPLWNGIGVLLPTSLALAQSAPSVAFGHFSGRRFPHGGAALAIRAPRYLIELFTPVNPDSAHPPDGTAQRNERLRITAIGFGMQESTHVVLQSIHAMAENRNQTPPRLSWREIGNWRETSAIAP